MVNSKTVQDGCVEIIDVYGILNNIIGEVVSLAVLKSCLDPASGHPHGKTATMVIATMVVLCQFAL